jgi:phage head maturation protease
MDIDDGTRVYYGGQVKALGAGRVGGYLVRFGSPEEPDQSAFRDYFTAKTDFATEFPAATAVYYNHGLDERLGRRRLADGAKMRVDEVGVWVEAQLKLRDEWERAVYSLAEAGKLSWSSGTAQHLVERSAIKSGGGETVAHEILAWPLGLDASLTPTPAEPRCEAVALKSIDAPALSELLPEFRSLAERTERWLDDGHDLLMGYQQVGDAQMKAGRPQWSRSRRERLETARQLIDDLLSETAPRDASVIVEAMSDAPRDVDAPMTLSAPSPPEDTGRLISEAFQAILRAEPVPI